MSLRRILGLRSRDIFVDEENNSSNNSLSSSESDLPSLPDLDTDIDLVVEKMPFDAKEAREDIPELIGRGNFQQFMAICEDFFDSLGQAPENDLVRIIKRKLRNIEAFTLCRNATTFEEIKTILSNKFGEKAPLNVLISDMVNLRQRDNEDAKTYGDRAILLQEKLEFVSDELLKQSTLNNKDISPVKYIYSRVIITYFINGLKISDIKNIVKSNNFSELEKAAIYANSLETSFKSSAILNKRQFIPNFNKPNRDFKISGGFSNNRQQNNNSSKINFNNNPGPSGYNSPKNFSTNNAGQFGNRNNLNNKMHIKQEFKTEPINNIKARTSSKCYFCGKIGHIEANCHERQRSQINMLESKNEKHLVKTGPDPEELQLIKSLRIS